MVKVQLRSGKKILKSNIYSAIKLKGSNLFQLATTYSRKSRKSNQVPKEIHVKDEIIQNPKNVSNAFNEYFVNVGNCLSNKISAATDCAFSATSLITINAKNSFFMRPIAESEILRHINGLKSSKSAGKFGIPIKYIKLSAKIVSPLLAKIYNNCIKTGCFPDILKIAEVIPLYKSGPKDICSNYRPISILSPFSKIFKKCLHFQLYNYFHQKNIFCRNQYGFRKNSSTNDAVIDIYNELLLNLNNKKITCSIFLDLAKAFDCINHEILLLKLEKYGIRGLPLSLFRSYLMNRKQVTIVNDINSDMNDISCGVPQGSTLGPLLFIIYVNDLPLATNLHVRLFADDTNITASHHHKDTLEKIVNKELKQVNNWMKLNKLSINYKKTEYIIITNKKEKPSYDIKIDQTTLCQNSCIKYLGVLIDDTLTWKPQVDKMCSKLASGCWALYQLRPYVNSATLMMVYYSFIHSHLNYCINS